MIQAREDYHVHAAQISAWSSAHRPPRLCLAACTSEGQAAERCGVCHSMSASLCTAFPDGVQRHGYEQSPVPYRYRLVSAQHHIYVLHVPLVCAVADSARLWRTTAGACMQHQGVHALRHGCIEACMHRSIQGWSGVPPRCDRSVRALMMRSKRACTREACMHAQSSAARQIWMYDSETEISCGWTPLTCRSCTSYHPSFALKCTKPR